LVAYCVGASVTKNDVLKIDTWRNLFLPWFVVSFVAFRVVSVVCVVLIDVVASDVFRRLVGALAF
jgi:hypothetical protein